MATNLLLDTNSLFARTWYATASKPDAARHPDTGATIEASRISLHIVLSLLDPTNDRIGEKIDNVLFCWDTQRKNDKDRGERTPEYEEEKLFCADVFKRLFGDRVNAMPEGFEADDIVCTALESRERGSTSYVVTGDKDLHQLMTPTVKIYCLNNKGIISPRQVTTKWNIARPDQLGIALAIIGDSVDNIKGIPGWGPKKAASITSRFTEDMDLDRCTQLVFESIPDGAKGDFAHALDLTLLDPGVPGVQPMQPVEFNDGSFLLDELDWFDEDSLYRRVKNRYRVRQHDDLEEGDD